MATAQKPKKHETGAQAVAVVSGEIRSGTGDTFAPEGTKLMPAGSYYALPAGTRHFAEVPVESVIQMHGVGPWQIVYVNPADEPRRRS